MDRDFGEVGRLLKRGMMEISTSDEVAYSVICATSFEPGGRQVESKASLLRRKRYDFSEINTPASHFTLEREEFQYKFLSFLLGEVLPLKPSCSQSAERPWNSQ